MLILGVSKSGGDPPPLHKKCGDSLKYLDDDFMIKFKLMKNISSIYCDMFKSGLLLLICYCNHICPKVIMN